MVNGSAAQLEEIGARDVDQRVEAVGWRSANPAWSVASEAPFSKCPTNVARGAADVLVHEM